MSSYSFQTVAVIGAGTMGQGIARTCAMAGIRTYLVDQNEVLAVQGIANLLKAVAQDCMKSKISETDVSTIQLNLADPTTKRPVCDLVIEAIVENEEIKQNLFCELENEARGAARNSVLTTNTSSLSVSKLARGLNRPERFAGIHFFNPAHIMKLVEVVSGESTDPELIEALMVFVKNLGKTPVLVKDSPGFIVNRVARHYYLEALRLLEEGRGGSETIDQLLRASGFKMGPFELMDLIGIDINLNVTKSVYDAFDQDPKFKPSRIQEAKVASGHLGRKSGTGFYNYEKN